MRPRKAAASSLLGKITSFMKEHIRENTLLHEKTNSINTEGLSRKAIFATDHSFVPYHVEEGRTLNKGLWKHHADDRLSDWINSNLESEGFILE